MAKYKDVTHNKGYFCGGSNENIKLITCKNKIVILSKIQSYVLNWYHKYLLHPVIDRTEATIFQHLYWTNIRDSVRKGVTNCDNCPHIKLPNKKYGRLPAKLSEEMPWNKLCVDLIVPYVIQRKGQK